MVKLTSLMTPLSRGEALVLRDELTPPHTHTQKTPKTPQNIKVKTNHLLHQVLNMLFESLKYFNGRICWQMAVFGTSTLTCPLLETRVLHKYIVNICECVCVAEAFHSKHIFHSHASRLLSLCWLKRKANIILRMLLSDHRHSYQHVSQ